MSWTITGTEKYETDPYRSQVSLLLHGDGTNGSTTITDSSPTPRTVTAFGNAQISTAQSKFGGASIAFDGNGDYLSTGVEADWTFLNDGTAFTGEVFVRVNQLSGTAIIAATALNSGDVGFYLAIINDKPIFRIARKITGSFAVNVQATTVLSLDTWYHLAFVLEANGSAAIYVDGILEATGTASSLNTLNPKYPLLISGVTGGSVFFNGYIDDLRITKGVARYTSNFTPPTAPFPDI